MAHFPKPFFKKARGLWYVEIDRRQNNLGPDREDAFRRYHQLMRAPKRRAVSDRLVASIADALLDWVQAHRSPDTYEWYRYRLQRFCQRYPELRIEELRPLHVQTWVDSYPGLSQNSKRNYIRTVKRCLRWADRQGYVDANPIAYLEVPGAESREVWITADEYAALLTHLRDQSFRDLVFTTWETGCRPQESFRVEAQYVDLARRRWVFPVKKSKGKKAPRVVYLTDAALEITRRRMIEFPTGPLFRNVDGRPWTPDAASRAFFRVRIRMGQEELKRCGEPVSEEAIAVLVPKLRTTKKVHGVETPKTPAELRQEAKRKLTYRRAETLAPRYSLYALRHSWATRALQSGVDALTVAILMGHSDPGTLARVYQHLSHNSQHLLAGPAHTNSCSRRGLASGSRRSIRKGVASSPGSASPDAALEATA